MTNKDRFRYKYQSKTNSEFERIAASSHYVPEAREMAANLLKYRTSKSITIDRTETEVQHQHNAGTLKKAQIEASTENIIRELKKISINETKEYRLRNGNELQIKRISGLRFQVRIEGHKSMLAPVMILDILDDKTFRTFPFFYLKGLLVAGLGMSILAVVLTWFNMLDIDIWDALLMPPLIVIGFQILLTPVYFANLKFLRDTLGK